MTPDELLDLLQHGTPLKMRDAVCDLNEAERKKLSKTAKDYYAEVVKEENSLRFMSPQPACTLARFGLLAVCSWTDAKKAKTAGLIGCSDEWEPELHSREMQSETVWMRHGDINALMGVTVQILIDRNPDWVARWVEQEQGQRFSYLFFEHLLPYLRTYPDVEFEGAGFLNRLSIGARYIDLEQDLFLVKRYTGKLFQSGSGFLGEIPPLKEVDLLKWQESSHEEPINGYPYPVSWGRVLYHAAWKGLIEREELLDHCFIAFQDNSWVPSNSNLINYLNILDVSDTELSARKQLVLDMLTTSHASTINKSLEYLTRLWKTGELKTTKILERLPDLLEGSTRQVQKKALSLCKTLLKKNPESFSAAIPFYKELLSTTSADTQELALIQLQELSSRIADFSWAEFADSIAELPEYLRQTYLNGFDAAKQSSLADFSSISGNEFTDQIEHLRERIESYSGEQRTIYGLENLEECLKDFSLPEPVALVNHPLPVLDCETNCSYQFG
ncbi:MAG: DUF6493 family protein [Planctomycetaceae bacterium]